MADILKQVLEEFPYFEDDRGALNYALDLLTGRSTEQTGDTPQDKGNILEGTLFFYGSKSNYLEVEGASKGIRDASRELEAYDRKRVVIEENSFLYRLEQSKRPMAVILSKENGSVRNTAMIEFRENQSGETEIRESLTMNQSLVESSTLLVRYLDLSSLVIFASPLGVLKLGQPVPKDQFFETTRFGALTGYAILYLRYRDTEQRVLHQDIVDDIERALQILWIIGNSRERFKLFRYERKAKGNFMAEIVHRIRGVTGPPINAVVAIQGYLSEGNDAAVANYVRDRLPRIPAREALSYIANLEDQLLVEDASRIDFDELCREVVENFERIYSIDVKLEGISGATIVCVKSEISFCIDELLTNARRYKKRDSRISVSISTQLNRDDLQRLLAVHPTDARRLEGNFVRLSVRNEGPGIPSRFKEEIFMPQKRLKKSHLGKVTIIEEKGSVTRGMGLYLVRRYIQDHYGGFVYENGVEGEFACVNALFLSEKETTA